MLMKNAGFDYASEFELLQKLEFGDRLEPYVRSVAVSTAGVLIYIYTGWVGSLVWALFFLAALAIHSFFIATRRAFVPFKEVTAAALLFGTLQVSYAWFPVVLFTSDRRELTLVGGSLIAAQLLFIVRRSDALMAYNVVQIVGLMGMSGIVYFRFLPDLETPLALIGAAFALIALNYYFWQTLRTSRRMRINYENAARQAHQAQKMAAIGQLAGGVAHDFNNNLTAIIGSLEILQMMNDSPETRQDIYTALVGVRQAAKTVKQLMLFARVEKPNLTVFEVEDIFEELVVLTKHLIPTSVALEIADVSPGLVVRADRNQLLTGLINLIVNGIDAMPQGGLLTLDAKQVDLSQPAALADGSQLGQGTYAKITIMDNGDGIPPHILPSVVEPFFTTKAVGKGTGLGLSMVAGIMREFGGGLSIRSEPGKTSADLLFPLLPATKSSGERSFDAAEINGSSPAQ